MNFEKGNISAPEESFPYYRYASVYILENLKAQRVKVGMTTNDPVDRLRSFNAMWTQLKGTCQICGGRRWINLRDKVMPTHTTTGAHQSFGSCSGSSKPPMERDVSLAESYLEDLKQRQSRSAGAEKGSLTKMIKNLKKKIERYSNLEFPVGRWHIRIVYYTGDAVETESLSHQILSDYLDTQAPFGEVFKCSVSEAAKAVEQALSQLGLLNSSRKKIYDRSENDISEESHEYQEPERKSAKYGCVMCRSVMCHSQWEGLEPGIHPCPKCGTHLYSKFLSWNSPDFVDTSK